MPRSYTEERDLIEQLLQDSTNLTWSTAELDDLISEGLLEISRYVPYMVKLTLTTTASKSLTLTAEQKRNLLWIDKLEYFVDKDPLQYRNFTRVHDTITMDIEWTPSSGDSVYLYVAKKHILTPPMNDLLGAVNALTAAGSVTLVVKSLGTGKVPEGITFTIAGDATVYTVIDDATITAGVATLYISPVLAAQAALDAVVTFTEGTAASTLDADLEILLANLVAANAMINKGAKYIKTISPTSKDALQQYLTTGNLKLARVLRELRGKRKPRTSQNYPTI